MTDRRDVLALLALSMLAAPASAFAQLAGDAGEPFSWEGLKSRAADLSREPWRAPPAPPEAARANDYDAMSQLRYRPDRTLWANGQGGGGVRFFPLMKAATRPVEIFIVEGGNARPFVYDDALFSAPDGHPFHSQGDEGGFSGFRAMNENGRGDWLAFLGASYFRSAGALDQYGLSARGLAIDTGLQTPEEFPVFTHFWLERGGGDALTVYALLDGPSVAGAYRFINRRGVRGVVQEVTSFIRLRRSVERLGFAPLTSMFWYGEGNRQQAVDWRPEIHDSDGLAMLTGRGERIWRPLVNPTRPLINAFGDKRPRGFGLLQRDRDFSHYQDDGVFYERRPSLWVGPIGDWGARAVVLYEIPTRREVEDNIVAFWMPEAPARAGRTFELSYRLNWIAEEPQPLGVARAVDTWTGVAGRPGQDPIPGARRIVIDFEGPNLRPLTRASGVEAVVSVVRGRAIHTAAYPVVGQAGRWRLVVDVQLPVGQSTDFRAYLRQSSDALTETFIYHFL